MDTTMRNAERAALSNPTDGDTMGALLTVRQRAGLCPTCGVNPIGGTTDGVRDLCGACKAAGEMIGKAGGPVDALAWCALGHRAPRRTADAPPDTGPPGRGTRNLERARFDHMGRLGAL